MRKILIFAGTIEGRRLAFLLAEQGIAVTVCVATAYGREVLEQAGEHPLIKVQSGRLTEKQMEDLLAGDSWRAVVDATHPFAVEASKNIAQACVVQNLECLRLLRQEDPAELTPETSGAKTVYVDSAKEAVEYLNQQSGNIFLTTGSKELSDYVEGLWDLSRLYVRILPVGAEVERCHRLGLSGKQIICMQGPFSKELNAAMLRQVQASVLVTKETGKAGGFSEKLLAAAQTGIDVLVIRRPKEQGYSMSEILKRLGAADIAAAERRITLAGMGMGALASMTREVYQACCDADLIIGAKRMLETVKDLGKTSKELYQSQEIADYVKAHPAYQEIVILLSGDLGFYSGAKKLRQILAKEGVVKNQEPDCQIRQLCGVPSVAYFAARLGMCWEDFALLSLHGRRHNLPGALESHRKVFALTDGAKGVRMIARELLDYGFFDTKMYVGSRLSYPEEEILQGTPQDFLEYHSPGVSSVILLQEQMPKKIVTQGIADALFFRGKAPMTKEEVRVVSLSKLALTDDAVVWDIGAGTGSVAVECARQCLFGKVYAIEKNQEALELLKQNKYRHKAWNLEIIAGEAPEALQTLFAPTHVFVGGSGGRLRELTALAWQKNPKLRLVLNVISLETLRQVLELMEGTTFSHKEIVQISVSKAKELGRHPMMIGQNPVYVITLQK